MTGANCGNSINASVKIVKDLRVSRRNLSFQFNSNAMKKSLRKSLRKPQRSLENLSQMLHTIDYDQIRLHQKQYLDNLLETNRRLLKDFKIDNIIAF